MKELSRAYTSSCVLVLLCTGLTGYAVMSERWFHSHVAVGPVAVDSLYGLTQHCTKSNSSSSSTSYTCVPFPTFDDCERHGHGMCAVWRTSGFAMWLSLMLQCCSLFGLVATLSGNRYTKRRGWRIVCALIGGSVLLQSSATIALDAVLETNDLFHTGRWRISTCWAVATASWVAMLVIGVGLCIVGYMATIREVQDDDEYYDSDDYSDDFDHDDDDQSSLLNATRDDAISNYGSMTTSERDFRSFTKQARKKFLQSVGMA